MAMDLMPINIYIILFIFLISLVKGSFEKKTLGSIFFSLPFKSFGIVIFILLFLKLVS